METTYGDRLHKPLGPSVEELYGAVTDTFKRGGNVVIPTFALERAQDLLYFLNQGINQGRLMQSTQVFLDFADGDLGHRSHAASFGVLAARDREAHPRGT